MLIIPQGFSKTNPDIEKFYKTLRNLQKTNSMK